MEKIKKIGSRNIFNARITSIIAYFSIWGWIAAYFLGDREGAKIHLNQSLVLLIGGIICRLLGNLGSIFCFAANVMNLGLNIIWLIAFYYAIKGIQKDAPFMGTFHVLR